MRPVHLPSHRPSPSVRGAVATACLALVAVAWPAQAREIAWRSAAPATAASAAASLDARRLDVLNFNACGREEHFNGYMQRLRNADFDKQGEDTSDLVLAKIALVLVGCSYAETVAPNAPPPSALSESLCADRRQELLADGSRRHVTIIQPTCLRQQINTAMQAYRRHDKAGSSGVPCLPLVSGASPFASDYAITTVGEYDVDLAHVVRMLYLAPRASLDDSTVAHLWNELLSIRGAPGLESYSPVYDCGNSEEDLGSPEHYAEQEDGASSLLEDLGDAGEYLLKRLFLMALFYYTGGLSSALHEGLGLIPSISIPPVLALVPAALDVFAFGRIPESENHLLLINSSRYLTNQAMVNTLRANGHASDTGDIDRQQRATRDWLLKRLQQIAMNDFNEYNARSYQRYSLLAITNLFDFAEDPRVRDAAHIVLDFASAKAAVASNLGRRFAPFRRRSENDGYQAKTPSAANLYNRVSGADFGAARLMVLAGPTDLESTPRVQNLLPGGLLDGLTPLYAGHVEAGGDAGGFDNLVTTATSKYTLPEPILEIAVERPPLLQFFRHDGGEAYSAGSGFLLTAGGLTSGYANKTYALGSSVDLGVAMPTTLMLTDDGLSVGALVRFDGVGVGPGRTPNMCLTTGFACGVNVEIPQNIRDCGSRVAVSDTTWTFVNSAAPGCEFSGLAATDKRRHHVYFAIAVRNCSQNDGICAEGGPRNYGLLEVIDAPNAKASGDAAFNAFKASRTAALNWPNGTDGRYRTSDGRLLEFSIPSTSGPAIHMQAGGIRSIDGAMQDPVSSWAFLANGNVINAGHDGVITVTGPTSKKTLRLDLHDWTAPLWTAPK